MKFYNFYIFLFFVDILDLSSAHAAIRFTLQISVFLFVISFLIKRLFHKLLNQYKACLYLFECIFHVDSKYSNEIE